MKFYLEDMYLDDDLEMKIGKQINKLFPGNIAYITIWPYIIRINFKKDVYASEKKLSKQMGMTVLSTDPEGIITEACEVLPIDYDVVSKFGLYLNDKFHRADALEIGSMISDLEFREGWYDV